MAITISHSVQKKGLSVTSRRRPFLLLFVLLIGLCVRFIYLREISAYPNFEIPFAGLDEELNHILAQRIAAGDIFLLQNDYQYPLPLYIYFLGGIYALFGDSFWMARLLNIALGMGSIVLIYLVTKKVFRRESIALVAALGAALYGPYLYFDTSLYKTSFELFLLGLSLLLLVRAADGERAGSWFLPGLSLGLLSSVQGQNWLFTTMIVLMLLFGPAAMLMSEEGPYLKSLKHRSFRVCFLATGLILALLPLWLKSYYVSKDPFVANGLASINFYIGNHKGSWGGFSRIEGIRSNPAGHFYDARRVAEENVGHSLSVTEVSSYWKGKVFEFIREDRKAFLYLLKEKVRLIFTFYELNDYAYFQKTSPFLGTLPGIWLLLPLGMSGLFFSLKHYRKAWPLYISMLSTAAGMIMTFVVWRYRIPLTYCLWPFAGFLVVNAWDWIREKRLLNVSAASLLLIYFWIAGTAHPASKIRFDRDMKHNAALMQGSRDEKELHESLRQQAGASAEEKSDLRLKMALLRYRLSDTEGALRILKAALSDDPENLRLQRTMRLMIEQPVNLEVDHSGQKP